MTSITKIMTTEVLTLTPQHSLSDARLMMMENRIRHIPIVNENKELMGLISQRDVLAAEESSLYGIKKDLRLEREQSIKIADFYHNNLVTIPPQASVHQAALYLQKHKIGCLPVVEDNKLKGLVTDSDFVNVAINLLEVMNEPEENQYS
ncbi:CBS domain-containing protein [Thalassotalea psychrophila]|uniref:CBS domain-containing protein n=1 Tax=Thalassotalea psychrophila TaxID=3065647 RepID=A0ABY9TT20_9GAMM|nr:CBS domain-containing protein [Colwelliaceae bacterium SQ149]